MKLTELENKCWGFAFSVSSDVNYGDQGWYRQEDDLILRFIKERGLKNKHNERSMEAEQTKWSCELKKLKYIFEF